MNLRTTVVALLTVLCLVGTAGRAGGQAAPTIRTDVDTSRVTVGDRIRLTLSVEYGAAEEVHWPDSVDFGLFELIDTTRLDEVAVNGRWRSAMQYTLVAFELGDLEIPSVDVTVLDPAGSAFVLSSDAWDVTVVSVGQDESRDIRDIKGPLDIARNWLPLALWLAAIVVLGISGIWLFRRLANRRAQRGEVAPQEPIRQPHEIAYERLDRLEASGMPEQGEIKPYYVAVSDIIREYIEARYRIGALEMATSEVIEALERIAIDVGTRITIERFLSDCDLVKFAKWVPELAARKEMIPRGRRLVDETRRPSRPVATGSEELDAVAAVGSSEARSGHDGGQR